jgi:DNA repair protein RecO (recombination protein O)
MALTSDRCVCLRKTEYSETSQILTLFARSQGIVRVVAKGAHRRTKVGASKFDGGVDLLDVGDAVFSNLLDRELGTLCEWNLREGHRKLRSNLRAMYLGLYAAELVSMLIEEHDPHIELYDRLEAMLSELSSPRVEEIFLAFELDLLREAGYLPQMDACVVCGRELADRAYFSAASGGIVCRNCEGTTPDRMEMDLRLVRLVQGVLKLPGKLPRLTRHQTDPINRLLADHIERTLSRRLRMPAYVLG